MEGWERCGKWSGWEGERWVNGKVEHWEGGAVGGECGGHR